MSTAPTTLPPASSTSARPRRSPLRFLLAGFLAVPAIAVSVLLLGSSATAVTASLEAAAQGPAQAMSVTVHPDPWFVYSLEGTPVSGLTVTAPDGTSLPVTATSESFTWGPHREGLLVGTFEVPVGGGLTSYRISATPTQGSGPVTLAVTTFDVLGAGRLALWGAGVLLLVDLGVAVALVVLWPPSGRRTATERRSTGAGVATTPPPEP